MTTQRSARRDSLSRVPPTDTSTQTEEAAPPNVAGQGDHRDAPWLVFFAALLAYTATCYGVEHTHPGSSAYFDLLADAFLHGRLHLVDPPTNYDLTEHGGRWYVPFPPLPALLLMPWMAFMGLARTNPLALSIVMGAASVMFVSRMLDALAARGAAPERRADRRWLVLLFALGCVHWQVVSDGAVWFLAQTCTLTFVVAAACFAAERRNPALIGLMLAGALLGRPNVLFVFPFLAALALYDTSIGAVSMEPRRLRDWVLRSIAPIIASVFLLAAYNYARFENPFDFGYQDQNVSAELMRDLHQVGQFSLRHAPRNLYYMLFGPPRWPADARLPLPNDHGMSLFITMPALFWLFLSRRRDPLISATWISIGLLLLPLVLYYNTGWRQFGYRFSLDFMIPIVALLASVARQRVSLALRSAIVVGVLVNAWGVVAWHTNWLE